MDDQKLKPASELALISLVLLVGVVLSGMTVLATVRLVHVQTEILSGNTQSRVGF